MKSFSGKERGERVVAGSEENFNRSTSDAAASKKGGLFNSSRPCLFFFYCFFFLYFFCWKGKKIQRTDLGFIRLFCDYNIAETTATEKKKRKKMCTR